MFGFDDESQSEAALNAVKANPGDFVLKPQREGGGNNVYGDEVLKQLETMSTEDRAAHVLMQRIRPPHGRNVILRRGEPVKLVDTISELGIFGYTLGTKHSIKVNYSCLFRIITYNVVWVAESILTTAISDERGGRLYLPH